MGVRLKRLRDAAGLSQERLAEQANVPVGSIRNYEQDRRLPRIDAAARIAKVLGVSLDTLVENLSPSPEDSD